MGAYDKIFSGIPEIYDLLDSIRMGDNVVWQVTELEEFRFFCRAVCHPGDRGREKSDLYAVCRARAAADSKRRAQDL